MNGLVVVNHQHANLIGAGQAQHHLLATFRHISDGQAAALLAHKQFGHLPVLGLWLDKSPLAVQSEVYLLVTPGSSQPDRTRMLHQQTQHFEQGLARQCRIYQHQRQISRQVYPHLPTLLFQHRLEHPQRVFDQLLDITGLTGQLPLTQFILQFSQLTYRFGRQRSTGSLGHAHIPQQLRECIQSLAQLALQLAQADAQFIFDLRHTHPLNIMITKRQIASPFGRTRRRTRLGTQRLKRIFENTTQPLSTSQLAASHSIGDLGQQRMNLEICSIIQVLQGIFDLLAKFFRIHISSGANLARFWRAPGQLSYMILVAQFYHRHCRLSKRSHQPDCAAD